MSGHVEVDRARLDELLGALERMAGGEVHAQAPISAGRDELDAIAHAVNVLAGELVFRLRQLEKAQAHASQAGRMAALGEASAGLAHELANPLAILRGLGELTRELVQAARDGQPFDAELADRYLARMDDHVERISGIIHHVKDFSRPSARTRVSVTVNDVVGRALHLLEEQLRLQRITVERQLDPASPVVAGDPLRLEQVLINLLTNARDAIVDAGRGGGRIVVRSEARDDGSVELSVTDDGVGMAPALVAEIFAPFFTTKVGHGTGLGLSISREIVAEHGGVLACESAPGLGTKMIVRLPGVPAGHA